jgi:inner membrane protein
MGLKRLTPYAMPALIVAANLPDIDSFIARPLGIEPIAEHRGFTHGLGGMVTMPFLAAAIIFAVQKLSLARRPRFGLGTAICCILRHPEPPDPRLLTSYGTRLLEPLLASLVSMAIRCSSSTRGIWIMLILGLELSWRAERLGRNWTRPAILGLRGDAWLLRAHLAISARAVAVTRPSSSVSRSRG